MTAVQGRMDQLRESLHTRCIACGCTAGFPARLRFVVTNAQTVEASFQPSAAYEGYAGMLHGGVIATLLDAAMTNCLFAHGVCGVTGELNIRFRGPVNTREVCRLRAWHVQAFPPLFVFQAELSQSRQVKATAVGKFMRLETGIQAEFTVKGA